VNDGSKMAKFFAQNRRQTNSGEIDNFWRISTYFGEQFGQHFKLSAQNFAWICILSNKAWLKPKNFFFYRIKMLLQRRLSLGNENMVHFTGNSAVKIRFTSVTVLPYP
jgi:hypothetical protein